MTEIELAALVEQYTGLTDKQSPAYAQAYRLAHAVMTAEHEKVAELERRIEGYRLSSIEQWRRKKEWQARCNELTGKLKSCYCYTGEHIAAVLGDEAESRKDLPSPAAEGLK